MAHRCRFRDPEVVRNTRELIVNHLRHRIVELDKERAGIGLGGGNICTVRNMILTLSELVSLTPLRLLAISRLETWLQNPVLKPVAKDLLCGSLRRNVAQVYGPASSGDETRRDRHGGAEPTKTLRAVTRETSGRRLWTTEETAGGRHHVLVKLR